MNLTGLGGQGSGGTNAGLYIDTVGLTVNFGSNNNNALNFLNCIGGFVGSNNYGVGVFGAVTTNGTGATQFLNATGGGNGTGTNNDGLHFAANYSAPAIIAEATGGFGFGTSPTTGNVGINVTSGVTLGGANTNQIHLVGSSLGTNSYEFGIEINGGTVQVDAGGAIYLRGNGGGAYNGAGGNNYGVYKNSATLIAPGGSTVSGYGGMGSAGMNVGVYGDPNVNGPLTYANAVGGTGGNNNYGVWLPTPLNVINGGLTFLNVAGGGTAGSNNNYGVYVQAAVTATSIIASDVFGGPGSSNDIGFYISGAGASLGASFTNVLTITAGSLGTGTGEVGIQVDTGGTIQVGDGGTMNLVGTGGGLYNGTGTNNHGVSLAAAILTAGNGGSPATAINISGIGGHGSGGVNYGVNIATSLAVNLNNTSPTSSLNFNNCIGGTGGNGNNGVNFGIGLTMVNGSLNFLDVVGGGTAGSSSNFGLNISGVTVTAPVITGRDLAGGPGSGSNYGLNIGSSSTASQLGTSITNVLTISATSLGSGSNEYGINIFGTGGTSSVVVGSGATLALTGTGGGIYNGTGSNNYGIHLNNAIITSSGAGATTMTLTGLGGQGSNTNAGVYIDALV